LEHAEQKDVWRQVENYVVRALSLHESQLSKGATVSSTTNRPQQQTSPSPASSSVNGGTDDDASSSSVPSIHTCERETEGSFLEHGTDATPYVVIDPLQSKAAVTYTTHGDTVKGLPAPAANEDKALGEQDNLLAAKPPSARVAATADPAPEASASTPTVRTSLGFGGHVALGFGRSYGKAVTAMKPKVTSKSTEKKPEESKAVMKPSQVNSSEAASISEESKPSARTESSVQEQISHPLCGYRSRVNSGEIFGSTVKKFLLTGSNSIVGAISTATGRTSPMMSLSGDTLVTPLPHPECGGGTSRASQGLRDGDQAMGDLSPTPSVASVPGDILANYSKDVSYLGSPVLLTPSLESPSASSSLMMIELDCDPRILRSLSLPFVVPREHDLIAEKQERPPGDDALATSDGSSPFGS
jgi:hypothetical protein